MATQAVKITPAEIREFVELHQVGWRRAAQMMLPDDVSELEYNRLANRIKGIMATDRKRARRMNSAAPQPAFASPAKRRRRVPELPEVHSADLEREEYLRRMLAELEQDIAEMRNKGSWQALVSGHKQALSLRTELDELQAAQEEEAFNPTDIDQIVTEVLELGVEVLRHPRLIEAVEAARVH